jgi:hypothetical protein
MASKRRPNFSTLATAHGEGGFIMYCGLAGSGWNLSGPAGWSTEKIWLHRVRVRLGVRLGLGSGLGSGSGLGLGLGLRLGCKKAEKTESIRGVPIRIPVPLPPSVSGFYQVADRSRALPPPRVGRSVPSFTHFLGGYLSGQLPAASKVGWSVGYFTHCATSSGKILSVCYRLCVLR